MTGLSGQQGDTVPHAPMAAALEMIENVRGRGPATEEQSLVELDSLLRYWGRNQLIAGFGGLIYLAVTTLITVNSPDVVVADIKRKLEVALFSGTSEHPPELLTLLEGAMQAAVRREQPHEWRKSRGPMPENDIELEGWFATSYLLVDKLDRVMGPGAFAVLMNHYFSRMA